MNHLQEAKKQLTEAQELHEQGSTTVYKEHEGLAIAHALIAITEVEKEKSITSFAMKVNLAVIAEQLEGLNKRIDTMTCEECLKIMTHSGDK